MINRNNLREVWATRSHSSFTAGSISVAAAAPTTAALEGVSVDGLLADLSAETAVDTRFGGSAAGTTVVDASTLVEDVVERGALNLNVGFGKSGGVDRNCEGQDSEEGVDLHGESIRVCAFSVCEKSSKPRYQKATISDRSLDSA